MPDKAATKRNLKDKAVALQDAISAFYGHRVRTILPKLRELDGGLTTQWVAVNSAKSTTAGLAVASAVSFFLFPPAGIGLGIASAVTGVTTAIGDWVADSVNESSFKGAINADQEKNIALIEASKAYQEALAAARRAHGNISAEELLEMLLTEGPDWFKALELVLNVGGRAGNVINGSYQVGSGVMQLVQLANFSSVLTGLGEGINGVVRIGTTGTKLIGIGGNGALQGTTVVASASVKVLGSAAAVFSVADMVWSWSTSKSVQTEVRQAIKKIEDGCESMRKDFPRLCE